MIHLTLTGPLAGTPYCGCLRNTVDKFCHAPYAPYENWGEDFKRQLCPECKRMLFTAAGIKEKDDNQISWIE